MEYVLDKPVDDKAFSSSSGGEVSGFERVDWVVDDELSKEIEACEARNKEMAADSDASQLWWGEYGVEWIKKHGQFDEQAWPVKAHCMV